MRSSTRVILAAALALTLIGAGCSKAPSAPAAKPAPKPASTFEAQVKTLEDFFTAPKKTGAFKSVMTRDDGTTEPAETGKFWVNGRKFRIEYFKADGTKRIAIVSPDGVTAYFVRPELKISEPAVTSVDHYLALVTKPDGKLEDAGKDASGYSQLRYVVKKIEDMKDADNKWYTEDFTYLFKDGELARIVSRGNTLDKGKIKPKMDTFTYDFTELHVGGDIPASAFELEFPKK